MLEKGRVVKSLAGRDKDYLMAVIQSDEKMVTVCDGKERRLESPKSKNIRHVEATPFTLSEEEMLTNRALKKTLRRISEIHCDN